MHFTTSPLTRDIVVIMALACLLALGPSAWASPPAQLWTEQEAKEGLDPDAPVSMSAFARLAKTLSPSVINISVRKTGSSGRTARSPFFGGDRRPEGYGQGLGTGFIIHPDGFAITNHHVVEGASAIEVQLADEQTYSAYVIGTYPELDVALIRFVADFPLTPAPLGDSGSLQIGEWVIAIGNPFGLNHTVTAGIVSAKGRRDVHPSHRPTYANFIQTDASINPGNSGGPLINIHGEVVGINTAINAAGQGIGFAVPINMVKTILPQLAKGRVKRSYLGVRIGPVNRALAIKLGMKKPSGALVREVLEGGSAESAGLQPGDVITAWNGRPLDHWEDLSWVASTSGAEERVELMVFRGAYEINLFARMKAHPDDHIIRPTAAERRPRGRRGHTMEDLGIQVAKTTKERRKAMSLKAHHGVLVTKVDRGSAAHFAGLEVGDIIVHVNNRPIVRGLKEFKVRVSTVKRGEVLSLLVRRGDRTIFVAFTR